MNQYSFVGGLVLLVSAFSEVRAAERFSCEVTDPNSSGFSDFTVDASRPRPAPPVIKFARSITWTGAFASGSSTWTTLSGTVPPVIPAVRSERMGSISFVSDVTRYFSGAFTPRLTRIVIEITRPEAALETFPAMAYLWSLNPEGHRTIVCSDARGTCLSSYTPVNCQSN